LCWAHVVFDEEKQGRKLIDERETGAAPPPAGPAQPNAAAIQTAPAPTVFPDAAAAQLPALKQQSSDAIATRQQYLEDEIKVLRQEMNRLQVIKQATEAQLLETRRTVKNVEYRLVRTRATSAYQVGDALIDANKSWKGLLRLPGKLLGVFRSARTLRRTSKTSREATRPDVEHSTEAIEFVKTALQQVERHGANTAAVWAKANAPKQSVLAYALMEVATAAAREDPWLAVTLGTEAIHLYPLQQRLKTLAFLLGEYGHVRAAVTLIDTALAASAHFNGQEAKSADHLRALGRLFDAPPVVPAAVRSAPLGSGAKRMVIIGQQTLPFAVSCRALRLHHRAVAAAAVDWTALVLITPASPGDRRARPAAVKRALVESDGHTVVDGVNYLHLAKGDQPEEVVDLHLSEAAASIASAAVAAGAVLIEAEGTPIYGLAAALAARSVGCALVLDFDDLMEPHEAYTPGMERSEKVQGLLGLSLVAAQAADACRVHHPNLLRFLESTGIERAKLVYVPYRFAHALPAVADVVALAHSIGVHDGPVIGVVRDLCDSYDTLVLADLLATLAPVVAGLKLLIVGQGRGGTGLQKRAAELGVGSQLVLIDKPDPNLMAHYRALIDVTVFTRHDTPRAALLGAYEVQAALAGGSAVVAYRTADTISIIEDGSTGVLCAPGDISELRYKVQLLLERPDMRRMFGDAARDAALAAAAAPDGSVAWPAGPTAGARRVLGPLLDL
jgi:Glycosyl transferases group 1